MDRITHYDPAAGPSRSTSESVTSLDIFQEAGSATVFSSWDLGGTDYPPPGNRYSLLRGHVGIENLRTGPWRSTVMAGDMSIRFTNFGESLPGPSSAARGIRPSSPSPFAHESALSDGAHPDITFRGGAIQSARSSDSLQLFSGKLTRPGVHGEQAIGSGSLHGAKWARRFNDSLFAGIGVARAESQKVRTPSGWGTADTTLFLVDGAYLLNRRLKLVGEWTGSLSNSTGGGEGGQSFKAGSILTGSKHRLELNLRRVGAEYLFLNDELQTERDLRGLSAALEYRLGKAAALFSTVDWKENNLSNDPALPGLKILSLTTGGHYSHPAYPSLNINLSFQERASREPDPAQVDASTVSFSMETEKKYRPATAYLRVAGEVTTDKAFAGNSGAGESAAVGLRFRNSRKVGVFVEGENLSRKSDGGESVRGYRGKGGVSYAPFAGLKLSLDTDYSVLNDSAGASQRTSSSGGGARVDLPNDYVLNSEVRYNLGSNDAASSSRSSGFQLMLGLTKRFEWGGTRRAVTPTQGS